MITLFTNIDLETLTPIKDKNFNLEGGLGFEWNEEYKLTLSLTLFIVYLDLEIGVK